MAVFGGFGREPRGSVPVVVMASGAGSELPSGEFPKNLVLRPRRRVVVRSSTASVLQLASTGGRCATGMAGSDWAGDVAEALGQQDVLTIIDWDDDEGRTLDAEGSFQRLQ